jgi:type IV secretory pathway VirB10-like protein
MEATLIKRFGIGSTAFLFVLFGATSCFAQDKPEQHEEKAPAQHEQKAQPTQHQEKAQTAPREQKAQPTEHASKPQQAKPATQHSQPVRSAARTSPSTRTTASNRTQHTTTAGRSKQSHNFGGHGGGRIADVKFRASFGSSHHFHMNRPEIYSGLFTLQLWRLLFRIL